MSQFFDENPPDTWVDCEQCGGYHPPGYFGLNADCRNDLYRWPSTASIAALKLNPQHGVS